MSLQVSHGSLQPTDRNAGQVEWLYIDWLYCMYLLCYLVVSFWWFMIFICYCKYCVAGLARNSMWESGQPRVVFCIPSKSYFSWQTLWALLFFFSWSIRICYSQNNRWLPSFSLIKNALYKCIINCLTYIYGLELLVTLFRLCWEGEGKMQ